MATGIVSIALSLDHQTLLAHIWLGLTAAAWVALALATVSRLRSWLRAAAGSPASLATVAATAVLGSGFSTAGSREVPIALLAAAAGIYGVLAVVVLRERDSRRTGSAFMATVSLQSLAGLAALESGAEQATWLCYCALALCATGLALYPVVLTRFDPRQLLRGTGDQWIAGGALAISALTTSEISRAARQQTALHALGAPLAHVALAIWVLSMLWLPALLAAEVVAPRLAYHARRWSTLFPVGMYAACAFDVARTSGLGFAQAFATGWTWVAVALWLLLATGMARRSSRVARPAQPPG
jgi:hypothetical protein